MPSKRLSIFDWLTVATLGLSVITLLGYLVLFIHPYVFFNPYPPPRPAEIAAATATPASSPTPPPTYTPTGTPTVTLPPSPRPTRTPTRMPTATPTWPPTPTQTPTQTTTPQPSRSPLPFVCELAYQQPPYTSPWSGVAGHFQNQNGNPLPGYHAQVECPGAGTFTLRAGADERLNNIYGNPAAWEQSCNPTAYQPMEVRVRLFNDHPDPDGTTQQVSELVIVQLRGDIYGSLGYVTCTLNWQGWR